MMDNSQPLSEQIDAALTQASEPVVYFDNNGQIVSKVSVEQVEALLREALFKIDSAYVNPLSFAERATWNIAPPDYEALKAENESLKLRVAELEENILHVTEKRDYFEQIRRTCAEMTMKLTADNVRLQSECDRLRIVEFDGALNKAGWTFLEALPSYDNNTFNFVKKALKVAIEKWISVKEQEK